MALRGGLILAALLAASALPAAACTAAPHQATAMPETLSNNWPGHGGSFAWYDGPTTRYPHGVLGDTIEATRLHAYSEMAQTPCGDHSLTLPEELVFEDIAPRLADLDFDGMPEIITVQSHQRLGAQLAVYQAASDGIGIDLVATTPFIGRRNRWLAPIGIADFNGDGQVDIAYIDRPHLARTLRVWSFVPGGLAGQGDLREIAVMEGLTNHRIGEDFITGGVRDCGAGPEMIVVDPTWTQIIAVTLQGDTPNARALGPFSAAATEAALACQPS